MKRLVVGVLAHVDSGKTTLTEGMLYCSGEIKKLGRVDHGDAFLDSYELERERGITIFSKQAILRFRDTELTLLDTPGHVDFSPEMERTLQVLDYAILVISGTDGVQSHTETLWRLLTRHHIPTFIFVNKMDLPCSGRTGLISELKNRLNDSCIDFSEGQKVNEFNENLAMCDEKLMNEFLQTGELNNLTITNAVSECKIFPCYFGSALKLIGIDDFLAGIERYTKRPIYHDEFGAKIFKIARDEQGNRLTYLKITGGSLKVRDLLNGKNSKNEKWSEKVNQIRLYSGTKFSAVDETFHNMVYAVTGLTQTYAGEGLGIESESEIPLLEPVFNYRVELPFDIDAHTALKQLRLLEEEEPELHVVWNEKFQEIHIQLMGEVQLEILKCLIFERFKMEVNFDKGSIVYKETIADIVEGIGHFEPLRHYAEVHLLLEPTQLGSGLTFSSSCSEDNLNKNWQHLILTHLEEKIHVGVLTGAQITDMKITLAAGRAHIKHTEGGDFRQATYRAVRQGLKQAQCILLEPWYAFKLEIPTENVGRAMADMQRMNAEFTPPEIIGEMSLLIGNAPIISMRRYQAEVTSYTKGKGRLTCTQNGYRHCHNSDEVIKAIGYDSDSDILNTADSVFCAHGVGFSVKWDKVPEFMHIESVMKSKPFDEKSEELFPVRRKAVYTTTLAQDKELMEIYERTYGTVNRDPRTSFRTVHKKAETIETSPTVYQKIIEGPEYLLVDGYNIIFAWEDLSAIARDNLDAARHRLIHILCNYQGFRKCELILVFDAYKVRGNQGEVEKINNISVIYTKEAETADMYIEKVTHELGKKYRVRVATSDGLEQLIIMGHGAFRITAKDFCEEVDLIEKDIRSYLK